MGSVPINLKPFFIIVIGGLLFIFISLFKTYSFTYAATPELKWSEGFEGSKGGTHSSGCGNQEYIKGNPGLAHSGGGVHMSEATQDPCSSAIRYYPTWDGNIPLPALVMFWMKTDVPGYPGISKTQAYKIIGGDRFSPLTVKERTDKGKSYQCVASVCNGGFRAGKSCSKNGECPNNALLMTTHIRSDGTFDIGHVLMTFRSASIKAPINEWFLHSAYIENVGSGSNLKTWVTIYMNEKEVSRGYTYETENKPWTGAAKHWHMGWYGDRNGNSGPFKIYNDDMKFYDVSSQNEAESIIANEIGGSPPPTSPPGTPTPTKKPTSTPGVPTPTPTTPSDPSAKFKIGDRVETTETANVRESPGEGLIGTQPPGVSGTVVGGPGFGVGGNHWWWVIDYDTGTDGWSREDLLKKIASAPSPTLTSTRTPTPSPSIPGDLDNDNDVDIFDYNILLENFGNTNCGNVADIDGNCKVDIFDYNILLENFGL